MPAIVPNPVEADPVSAWMFLRALRASRLLPPADVDRIERQVDEDGLPAVTARLLDAGVLTPYQLGKVFRGEASDLVFGQYRILDELGQGGFGRVFKAHHALTDRVVALKVIAPHRAEDRFARDLFLREMAAGTRLSHPNVVMVFDANEADGRLFFAMEYVDGVSLEQYVVDRGPVPVDLARAVVLQVARALQAACERGLVHRDIKPANLLLTWPGPGTPDPTTPLLKVVDFGLARLSDATPGGRAGTILCGEGAIVGTPEYMAPEQACDVHAADVRSDLYSLGCAAYYALTGRPPFSEPTPQATCLLHLSQQPPPVRSFRADVPAGFEALLDRLLAKDPGDRFQTPAELITLLTADSWPTAPLETRPPLPVPFAGDTDVADKTLPILLSLRHQPPTNPAGLVPAFPSPPATFEELRVLWNLWSDMMTRSRSNVRRGVDGDYKLVHRALVRAVSNVDRWPDHLTFTPDRLLAFIEPWVSHGSLAGLDRPTHVALRAACGPFDAALGPDRKFPVVALNTAVLAACVGVPLLAAIFYSAVFG